MFTFTCNVVGESAHVRRLTFFLTDDPRLVSRTRGIRERGGRRPKTGMVDLKSPNAAGVARLGNE